MWDELIKDVGRSAFTARENEAKDWILTKIQIGPRMAMMQRMMAGGGGGGGNLGKMLSGKGPATSEKSINMCAALGCGNSDFLKSCSACKQVSYCSAGCKFLRLFEMTFKCRQFTIT